MENKKFRVVHSSDIPEHLCDGFEHNHYYVLIEFDDDKAIRIVGDDGGEPEDKNLVRDFSWVVDEMNKLYDRLTIYKTFVNDIKNDAIIILECDDE